MTKPELLKFVHHLKFKKVTSKEQIKALLTSHWIEICAFGVKEVGLFGSYARSQQHETSDIDLLVDFQEGAENFDNLMNLYDFLEKVFKDEKVEIVTKNGLSPYVGPSILREVEYV